MFMDSNGRDSKVNPVSDLEPEEVVAQAGIKDRRGDAADEAAESLLAPLNGGENKNRDGEDEQEEEERRRKARRKVRWNDSNGNKLAEILEFFPSDVSDSDDDDEAGSCFCTIM